MKPSEIIEQIDNLNKEINTLIEQLVSDKENPQIMDIDLLNQKLISIYDLSLKLRYKLNLGEVEIASEETELEFFHFEPKTSRFLFEPDDKPVKQVIIKEKSEEPTEVIPQEKEIVTEQVDELPKEEIIYSEPEHVKEDIVEPLHEVIADPVVETETIPKESSFVEDIMEVEQIEVTEPIIEPIENVNAVIEETIPETDQNETPYWSVETGWIKKPVEEIVEIITDKAEPEAVKEIIPEPEPIQQPEKPVSVIKKTEPEEKKPIFESITKPEKSLNEIMAENKEKAVINEVQKSAFKSAITLNLKISFIRELFQGNEKDYKKMIEFLTRCENYSEAKLYMQGEKEKHPEWSGKQELLNHLQELINRKFL